MTNQPKPGDTVTWVEFKGTKKEQQFEGKIVSEKDEDGGYDVECLRLSLYWVHEDKIVKVAKDSDNAITSERGE